MTGCGKGERKEEVTKLIVCRGLPGAGKSTRAKNWVAEDPSNRARVNRDDLREMIHDGHWDGYATERSIVAARDNLITTLLRRGLSVVNDDTNLKQKVFRDVASLATQEGAELEVWDLTDVSLALCVQRDRDRGGTLYNTVIPENYKRFILGKTYPLPQDVNVGGSDIAQYVPNKWAPMAIIVDIDGTVALRGWRSPFDETRVIEDEPNDAVIEAVNGMYNLGYRVIFLSGRTDTCREDTEAWLKQHVYVPFDHLFMRKTGDNRNDAVIKREIFDAELRDVYNIIGVFDDRQRVVDMWRSLGLTVFQVAPGNF